MEFLSTLYTDLKEKYGKGTVIFFLGKRQSTSQKKVRTHAKKNYAVKKIMSGEKNYRGKLQWGKYRYQKYFPTNFCPQKIGGNFF